MLLTSPTSRSPSKKKQGIYVLTRQFSHVGSQLIFSLSFFSPAIKGTQMNEAKAILSKALGIWGKGLKRLLGMLIVSNIASSQLLSLTFVLILVLILKLGLHII